MYLHYLGEVLFYRDRAQLQYHFGKIGEEGIAELLKPASAPTPAERARLRAWKKFIAGYGLPDSNPISESAAQEFLAAVERSRVPAWALLVAPLDDIKEAAGEVSE